jgi:thiamine-phosphate pyrophosphorylase
MKPIPECRLYGILDTGYVAAERMANMARSLIAGGIDILQLRAKKETADAILTMARQIAPLCKEAGIPFILNDHPSLVRDSGADGAHIGQDDMSVAEARSLAGPGALVGKSTHSLEQALSTAAESPDYLGFGPLFSTPTKPDYVPIGTEEITEVHARVSIPVFCIGGIKESNLPDVIVAGAQRVVIVSDLLRADNPTSRTAACRALLGA